MKIYITNKLIDEPTGGGNQFLKALKKHFKLKDAYTDDPHEADVVLFNSHQEVEEVMYLKNFLNKDIKFVHRVDGPMRLYNRMDDERDSVVYQLNNICADAIIFQSEWSRSANIELGMNVGDKRYAIISNAVDDTIFNENKEKKTKNKIKLISSSWSDNVRKGFDTYMYLDKTLDFEKYEFSFMGRSPYEFNNIRNLGPLKTEQVAENLQNSDIFITASENDPCSNSLIEALSCKLPVVALRSGGHPEIVKSGGILFDEKEEVNSKIDELYKSYNNYKNDIVINNISQVSTEYLSFFESL